MVLLLFPSLKTLTVRMTTFKKLKLKLLVDKEKEKVIFAESDKDFVDILFSFLTIPLGSVIRILNKQSLLGCMDKLYESIENLDDCYFSTEACKEMLLRPLNACGSQCEDLILRIDESSPRTFFTCKEKECLSNANSFFSLVPKARCGCGKIMDLSWYWEKKEHRGSTGDGVFLKGNINFIICDDLVVMPASTMNMHDLIKKHGIRDLDNIEETCIEMDVVMLFDFLKRSLVSKCPLSGMYFQKTDSVENPEFISKIPKNEDSLIDKESKKVDAKIFFCKSSNKVLYVEAQGVFVDLLFNILTIPLGSVVKLLNKLSSVGCLDNLYKSVENLSSDCKYFKPDVSNFLLHPNLAAHFSLNGSLFSVGEKSIMTGKLPGCHTCLMKKSYKGSPCEHGVGHVLATEMNPKLQSGAKVGGSYAKMDVKFLITDELEIKPFSTFCSIQTIKKSKASFAALEEMEIYIGEHDALNLLKSCLTSQSPFSNVFLQKKQRLMVKEET